MPYRCCIDADVKSSYQSQFLGLRSFVCVFLTRSCAPVPHRVAPSEACVSSVPPQDKVTQCHSRMLHLPSCALTARLGSQIPAFYSSLQATGAMPVTPSLLGLKDMVLYQRLTILALIGGCRFSNYNYFPPPSIVIEISDFSVFTSTFSRSLSGTQ